MILYSHDLDIQIASRDGGTVAHLVGNVDTVTADSLLAALQGAIVDGNARLVGDMSRVGYTSTAGLCALLGATKDARRRGGDLRLAAVGEKMLNVLQLSGFTTILRLYPDVDAALASFAE